MGYESWSCTVILAFVEINLSWEKLQIRGDPEQWSPQPRPSSHLRLGYRRRWFGENVTILIYCYSALHMQIKNLKTAAKNSHAMPALSLHKKKPIRNQAWIEEGLQREPTLHSWAVCWGKGGGGVGDNCCFPLWTHLSLHQAPTDNSNPRFTLMALATLKWAIKQTHKYKPWKRTDGEWRGGW